MVDTVIYLLVGICAGMLNGLNGNSAFGIVPPVLISFLGMNPYAAIGISLTTDVVSSAVTAWSYFRSGHIHFKTVYPMAVSVVIGALAGSFVSQFIPSAKLGQSNGVLTILIGFSFLKPPAIKSVDHFKSKMRSGSAVKQKWISVFIGFLIGTICGIIGMGGGRLLFLTLIVILGFPIHAAVGTAVCIMFFSALSGAVCHMVSGRIPWMIVMSCCTGAAAGAALSSRIAALTSEKKLLKITGIIFIVLGLIAFIHQYTRRGLS